MSRSTSLASDSPAPRVQRTLGWVLLAACAAATLTIGGIATAAILNAAGPREQPLPVSFWGALAVGAAATCAGVGVRTVRWAFLLRRAGVRIPLRDTAIAYLSGFSLLFVPFLLGETIVRVYVHRARGGVPAATTCIVNLWERLLDVSALSLIAAVAVGLVAGPTAAILPLTIAAATATRSFRRMTLSIVVAIANGVVRVAAPRERAVGAAEVAAIAEHEAWGAALGASIIAWALPALGLWAAAASLGGRLDLVGAQFAYASSALSGGIMLAPGGVRIVGPSLLASLDAAGLSAADAAIAVLGVRLVTAGLATVLGAIFVWIHLRTAPAAGGSHFDSIADSYHVQISPAQRASLLDRKSRLMAMVIERFAPGGGLPPRGLDVGCGPGWYVTRMRELGFDVHGIDTSPGQMARARANVDDAAVIGQGSILDIPAADGSYDFVYCINVLHHLASVDEQRAAFAELLRVLRPGGLVFVHEINTRSVLFRFYMGYVFPSLNNIDEGTERWLLPHRLDRYSSAPVVATEYFTFLPEFVPAMVLRCLRPIEALLEASPLRIYSGHYMAVMRKPPV